MELGFSGVFLQGVLSDTKRQNIRTKHLAGILQEIERLEGAGADPADPLTEAALDAPLPLDVIVRAAFVHGFSVEFRPLDPRHIHPAVGQ